MSVRSDDLTPPLDSEPQREPLHVPALIRQYHSSLLSLLRRRMRVAEDAADVAQEAYIRMMQYEGSREIQSPYSMLVRVASNVAKDLGRSERVRKVSHQCSIDDFNLVSDQPSPDRHLAASQDLDLLLEAIEELPPRCKQVFLLSRVNFMTYLEIAEHCGISIKMVEKHISHALAFCVSKVGGYGGRTS